MKRPTGVELIAQERANQKARFGKAHDAEHDDESLVMAAIHFAAPEGCGGGVLDFWPPSWDAMWDTKGNKGRIHDLTVAGALIAAEIDRLQEG